MSRTSVRETWWKQEKNIEENSEAPSSTRKYHAMQANSNFNVHLVYTLFVCFY